MTHFLLLIAVSAGLATFRGCPFEPVPDAAARALLVLAGMAMLPAVAQVGTAYVVGSLTAGPCPARLAFYRYRRMRAMHLGLWLLSVATSFFVLRWPQLVRANWRCDGLILGGDLVALSPAIVPLVLSWIVFYRWEVAVAAAAGNAAQPLPTVPSRLEYVMLHVRFYLSIAVLPALLLLTLVDAARWLAPALFSGTAGIASSLVGVAIVAAAFPWLLRRMWKSQPLEEGPLADALRQLADRAGVPVRQLHRWQTGGMVTNAAITGLLPRSRTVWLSDGLLDGMNPDRVAAVFAHELGHLRHRHLLVRMAVLLAPLTALIALRSLAPQLTAFDVGGLVSPTGSYGALAASATVGFALYMGIVFGWVCRRLELEADLFAAQMLQQADPQTGWSTVIEALEDLANSAGPADRNRAGWMHPSGARRVEFLKRCLADSDYLLHFRRSVGRLRTLWVWGTAALAFAGLLLSA